MPSPLPVNPSPSSVVALTFTLERGIPSVSAKFCLICSLYGASLGACAIMVTSTLFMLTSSPDPAIMSLIKAAEYQILLPDPAGKEAFGIDWKAAVDNLMQQDTVTITRTGKVHGQKRKIEVNARPLIYEAKVEDGRLLKVLCACGSEENLKIDLLVDALYRSIDRMDLARMETIDRVALYIRREDGSLQEESDFSDWPVHE